MAKKPGLVLGTLDMLVLRVLLREQLHGWGITEKLQQRSKNALRVEEGSLYPALYRMEAKGWLTSEWRMTDKGARAKYYTITRQGRRQLEEEKESWHRMTEVIAQVMKPT